MWYDQTKPTTVSLLVGDYHQMGIWMAAGGKVVAFDPAPTLAKGLLTSQRIKKGEIVRRLYWCRRNVDLISPNKVMAMI